MKRFSLIAVLFLALFLAGCGNKTANNNIDSDSDSIATKGESDFDMSDCMKGCEMLWNKKTSKETMLTDCKNICEAGEAMDSNDADSCEKSEGIMKDSCYSSIASETKNHKLCEKVSDGMMRYGCYIGIAEDTKDKSICDKIDDSMFKASCLDSLKSD